MFIIYSMPAYSNRSISYIFGRCRTNRGHFGRGWPQTLPALAGEADVRRPRCLLPDRAQRPRSPSSRCARILKEFLPPAPVFAHAPRPAFWMFQNSSSVRSCSCRANAAHQPGRFLATPGLALARFSACFAFSKTFTLVSLSNLKMTIQPRSFKK
jgi:hypothetical protein